MNYYHDHHITKSLVSGFCKKCKKTFHRDGDLVAFSSAYSTPSYKIDVNLENVTTYRDWLVFTGDLCDECLPPMPEAVKKDIEIENKRRSEDMNNYRLSQGVTNIPNHTPRGIVNEEKINNYIIKNNKISKFLKRAI